MYNRCRRRKDNLGTRDSMYNMGRRRKDNLGTRDAMYNNRCRRGEGPSIDQRFNVQKV